MDNSRDAAISNLKDGAVQSVWDALDVLHDWVDGKFGEGYAEKHPAMLVGCVQACATFYLAERLSRRTELTDSVDECRRSLHDIEAVLRHRE